MYVAREGYVQEIKKLLKTWLKRIRKKRINKIVESREVFINLNLKLSAIPRWFMWSARLDLSQTFPKNVCEVRDAVKAHILNNLLLYFICNIRFPNEYILDVGLF